MVVIIVAGVMMTFFWSVLFLKPLQNGLLKWFRQSISLKEIGKYEALAVRETTLDRVKKDFLFRVRVVSIVFTVGFIAGLYLYINRVDTQVVEEITRPDFGEGTERIRVNISSGDIDKEIELTINEREPEEEELRDFFKENIEEVFSIALEGNRSADRVVQDLKLIEETSFGAEVSWKISDMSYMNSYGKLRGDIPEDGEDIVLTATIKYGNYQNSYDLKIRVFPKSVNLSEDEKIKEYVSSELVAKEDRVLLPKKYGETDLIYKLPGDDSYRTVIILMSFMGVLLWLLLSERIDREFDNRSNELMRDYPEIISRISILLVSGMSISECWKKIGKEYEEDKKRGRKPSAGYEELALSVDMLQNTGQIEMAIASFGQRCNERYYRHLSTLLIQSLKKGSVQVSKQLQSESSEAFRIRKENARLEGEKARAKLMIPTFLLFILVLAIVIYPAWSGL